VEASCAKSSTSNPLIRPAAVLVERQMRSRSLISELSRPAEIVKKSHFEQVTFGGGQQVVQSQVNGKHVDTVRSHGAA
jgi:hypothetical protein